MRARQVKMGGMIFVINLGRIISNNCKKLFSTEKNPLSQQKRVLLGSIYLKQSWAGYRMVCCRPIPFVYKVHKGNGISRTACIVLAASCSEATGASGSDCSVWV